MAQSVEHVLGKDGVGSSNLPSSSMIKEDAFSHPLLSYIRQNHAAPTETMDSPAGAPIKQMLYGDEEEPSKKR